MQEEWHKQRHHCRCAQTSGQAADVSASDDTASSEEASSEVETEVVTDKAGHTVIETKASQSSDTKTTTNGNYTTITFNVKDQTQGAKADNRSGSVGYTVKNLKGVVNFSYTAKGWYLKKTKPSVFSDGRFFVGFCGKMTDKLRLY